MMQRRTFLATTAGFLCAAGQSLAAEPPADVRIDTLFTMAVAFSPDGKLLLTAGYGSSVATLWDVATREMLHELQGRERNLFAAGWSPDGRLTATAGDGGVIRLWDPAQGREVGALKGHQNSIRSLTFSPDGSILASGAGQTIQLWDVTTRVQRACNARV